MNKVVLGVCCCFAIAFNCYAQESTVPNGNSQQKSVSTNTNNSGGIYKAASTNEYGKVTWQYATPSPSKGPSANAPKGLSK